MLPNILDCWYLTQRWIKLLPNVFAVNGKTNYNDNKNQQLLKRRQNQQLQQRQKQITIKTTAKPTSTTTTKANHY